MTTETTFNSLRITRNLSLRTRKLLYCSCNKTDRTHGVPWKIQIYHRNYSHCWNFHLFIFAFGPLKGHPALKTESSVFEVPLVFDHLKALARHLYQQMKNLPLGAQLHALLKYHEKHLIKVCSERNHIWLLSSKERTKERNDSNFLSFFQVLDWHGFTTVIQMWNDSLSLGVSWGHLFILYVKIIPHGLMIRLCSYEQPSPCELVIRMSYSHRLYYDSEQLNLEIVVGNARDESGLSF